MYNDKRMFKVDVQQDGHSIGEHRLLAFEIVTEYGLCSYNHLCALQPGAELSCGRGFDTTFVISLESN